MKDKLLLREFQPLCQDGICNIDALNEAEIKLKNGGYTILTGILQSANKKNGNQRIYSREILERELNNYQKVIREHRSLGECVEDGAEILTLEGWKNFRDITNNEYIYTLNQVTDQIEIQKIEEKVARKHKGDIYHFYGKRSMDIRVTPGHKFYLIDRYGKKITATAEEIFDNREKFSRCHIPKLGNWDSPEEQKNFILPGVDLTGKRMPKVLMEKYNKSLSIDLKTWVQFMGIYLSEGCSPKNHGYMITITQNEGETAQEIRKMLGKFPEEIKWSEGKTIRKNGNIKVSFRTSDARLRNYLEPLGKSYEKYIPKEIKILPSAYLEELMDWFIMGDGRTRTTGENNYVAREVFSTSLKLINDLQEILLKMGSSGNISVREPYDRMIEGRLIKKENQHPLHILHLSTTNGIYLKENFMRIMKERYEGDVFCARVKNGTFCCRNKGKMFWSHNCDHPEETIISLKNASHMVLRTWWQGNDVWGSIKVLKNTPAGKILEGLITDGVQLGISSRGLGSLEETPQGSIVAEDFVLLCFDIVAEPSTHGAYLTPVKESLVKKLTNKADRINRLLNDIVRK